MITHPRRQAIRSLADKVLRTCGTVHMHELAADVILVLEELEAVEKSRAVVVKRLASGRRQALEIPES